ncbi:hypothetical protein [Actinocorallia lasiicapitis]
MSENYAFVRRWGPLVGVVIGALTVGGALYPADAPAVQHAPGTVHLQRGAEYDLTVTGTMARLDFSAPDFSYDLSAVPDCSAAGTTIRIRLGKQSGPLDFTTRQAPFDARFTAPVSGSIPMTCSAPLTFQKHVPSRTSQRVRMFLAGIALMVFGGYRHFSRRRADRDAAALGPTTPQQARTAAWDLRRLSGRDAVRFTHGTYVPATRDDEALALLAAADPTSISVREHHPEGWIAAPASSPLRIFVPRTTLTSPSPQSVARAAAATLHLDQSSPHITR